jgi:2-hydroxychromene-2-carboxylate isomerase
MTVWAQGLDHDRAKSLAAALYRGYFGDDQDITDIEVCGKIAAACGFDRQQAIAGANDDSVKGRLKTEMDQAIDRKVFGSPYFLVDGEPFWGADRLDQLERWLATGGW